jgi:hypothetical protein
MPLAVTLRLDGATASRIDFLTASIPDQFSLGQRMCRHHIKLAVYGDGVDVADLDAALATATGAWKKLSVTFAAVGFFPGEPSILWLTPVPTIDLLTLHTTLHRALADLASHPDYEVGAWVPHVVLARTEMLGDAVEVMEAIWNGPIVGWLDALDLVRLDSMQVLSSRPLRD